jgi:hypothetical protein
LFDAFEVEPFNEELGKKVAKYPERAGYIMCGLVLFSYLGSIPWFYLAGKSYTEFKRKEEEALRQS